MVYYIFVLRLYDKIKSRIYPSEGLFMFQVKTLSYSLKKNVIFFLFTLSCTITIFSCKDLPTNPDNPSNTTTSLFLKSSTGIKGEEIITDSIGKDIQIKTILHYPNYVNYVKIDVFNENGKLDTTSVLSAKKNLSLYDTIGIVYKPFTAGNKKVIATVGVSNGTILIDSAIITVFVKNSSNYKPVLTVEGTLKHTSGETCTLTVNVIDPDITQTNSVAVLHNNISTTLLSNIYVWTIESSFKGKDTLVFVTNDNGLPVLSDTETIIISILPNIIPDAPKWKSDTIKTFLSTDTIYKLPLKDTCYDENNDSLHFAIIGNSKGIITNGIFIYTVSTSDSGVIIEKIHATNKSNLSDTLTLIITFNKIDTIAPKITLKNPAANVNTIIYDSITVQIACYDESGIADVSCKLASQSLSVRNSSDSLYSVKITGLTAGKFDTITFVVIDNSFKSNIRSFPVILFYTPTYKVTYINTENSSGSVPVDTGTYRTGDIVTIKGSGALVKTGATFSGWNVSSNDDSVIYIPGTKFLIGTTNILLYAKWTIDTYTINYNLNGGINNATNPSTKTISSAPIALANPSKIGYTFSGWFTDSTLSGTAVTSINTGSVGNITLYAKWTPISYSITYILNGGTNGSNPATYSIESAAVTLINPTYTGYTFNGWYTDIALGGTALTSIPISSTGNIILYAKWTPINYTISYALNGGTNNSNPSAFTIESAQIILKNPTKSGYIFDGWYKTSGQIVMSIQPGTIDNITLSAKWTPISYPITYYLNDGINNSSNPTTYSVETATITLANPTRKGYTFAGWYTDAVFSYLPVKSIELSSIGSQTFYAKWIITDFDGNHYSDVTIGTQVWMAQNMRVTHTRNGTPIGANYVLSPNNSESNIAKFGMLYLFYYADSIAPEGWRLPTSEDFEILKSYIKTKGYGYNNIDSATATALASKTDWTSSSTIGAPGYDIYNNNKTGFTALPAGQVVNGNVESFGDGAYFWSKTMQFNNQTYYFLNNNNNFLSVGTQIRITYGLSVRLVRENLIE